MAASSSPRNWRHHVFTSFHGSDVRQGFLSHLRQQFNYNAITMFDDNGIKRSHIIAPALIQGIRDSRISIVLLSKNYGSSSWCLDELLEILECRENMEQTVMTIFYGVDPSDVRHQTGDFGKAFRKTCARKTKEKRRKWSEALTYVGNIAGEHFQNWHNEAEKIKKIASDVSDILKTTQSRDFDDIVGLESHMRKMESLLDLDNVKVKMVGISGPAGIGKSTIARALHSKLSNCFQCNSFMDNLRGSYNSGLDKLGLQLYLQGQLLSKVLNLEGIRISHLGVMKDRLQYQKVLIILDEVESLDQLEALANDLTWFGPGSRVIVTTENKEILLQHDINDIYEVDFPSQSEALKIFCLSAFKQTFPPNGFVGLANEIARICGNLPLGLHVLGSSLRGKSKAEWIDELPRLKDCLDGKIECVLKVGYESLNEKDQALFLHIAVFFNYEHVDYVTSMFAKSNFNVRPGLKVLANRNLIHIYSEKRVVMHCLLQVMARQVISKQQPSKRQILVDSQEICDVLEFATGNRSTVGVSFDVAEIGQLIIHTKAFERMHNLSFLEVYSGRHTKKRKLHVPEEMGFPRSIRLFHWDAYPGKSLHRFCPENLVQLIMCENQLEKLWEGRQPLANLKRMDLSWSSRLKELPDLSNATNLKELDVYECTALEELPSSIVNLHKISSLEVTGCKSLEVIPTLANLTSLGYFRVTGCSQLRRFPDIPHNFEKLEVLDTGVEELPASFSNFSSLEVVTIRGNKNFKTFSTHLPTSVTSLNLSDCGIERITDCIKGLHNLEYLNLSGCERLESLPELPDSLEYLDLKGCKRLVSLPELPDSLKRLCASDSGIERITDSIKGLHNLKQLHLSGCERLESLPELPNSLGYLNLIGCKRLVSLPELPDSLCILKACDCESLERVSSRLNTPYAYLDFTNCFKLDRQAQRTIIQQLLACNLTEAILPGREVPAEFEHRARGNSLTIPHSAFNIFMVCLVISHNQNMERLLFLHLKISALVNGDSVEDTYVKGTFIYKTKHLVILDFRLPDIVPSEVSRQTQIVLEFSSSHQDFDIIECGVQRLKQEEFILWRKLSVSHSNTTWNEASSKEEDDDDSIAYETFES